MALPTQVTNEHIEQLKPDQLVKVLWQLIHMELSANGIYKYESTVPLSIFVPDGGIDGLAHWQDGPEKTDHFPSRHVGFQAKATDMTVAACAKEVKTKEKKLKPQVRELLEKDGHYVLFLGRDCVGRSRTLRRKALKKAIDEASRIGGEVPLTIDEKKILIFDASDIAGWVNAYPSLVAQVGYYIGRPIGPAVGWEEMSHYPEMSLPYVETDKKRLDATTTIREGTRRPRTIVRVLGSSGLGKTRLLFEAFRPLPVGMNPPPAMTSDYCYVRAEATGLEEFVKDWRRARCKGVLVVDDCPLDLHERLSREVRHSESRLSLVTIGNDLDPTAYAGTDTKVINVEPVSDDSTLQLLAAAFPELSAEDRQFIARELSQGFPLMAIRVAQARKDNAHLTARLSPAVLAKLLGIPAPAGSIAERVISACSLFEYVGVYDEFAEEREFVRKTFCPDVSSDDFYATLMSFQRSGAITRYGRSMQVRPRPLAIRLAAQWWERCSPELAARIVNTPFPPGLSEAFCQRLRMLDFVPALKETAERLCGSQGPFGQAKVLRSELGSRLFRAIAEVNPVAAVKALTNAFAPYDEVALREIEGESRRNLVLALEKLCFRADTFASAAHFLGRLAAAENERWANNATGTFARLFMILLPGTQAPLNARLPIVQALARSSNPTQQRVAVEALENAIRTHDFTGTSGPEFQGSSGPQQEYRPKVWGEVFQYWSAALAELVRLATSESVERDRAAWAIAGNLRGLIQAGRLDDVDAAIAKVTSSKRGVWPSAMESIRDSLRFEGKQFPADAQERIASWLDRFEPQDIKGQIRVHVTDAPFQSDEDEYGDWQDIAAQRATDLGRKSTAHWEELQPVLPDVMSGRQHQAFAFGRGLAEGSGYALDQLNALLSVFETVEPPKRNGAVISGWLAALDAHEPAQVDVLFHTIANNEALHISLQQLLFALRQTDERLKVLASLLRQRAITPNQLHGLANGKAMNDVSAAAAIDLCDALLEFGPEGAWVTIDIASMYSYDDEAKWNSVAPSLKRALLQDRLLAKDKPGILIDAHLAARAAKSLLVDDATFARALARDVIDGIALSTADGRIEFALADILGALLERQLTETWPLLRSALSDSGPGQWRIKHLLRGRLTSEATPRLISKIPMSCLREWCEQAPNVAPYVLAGTIGVSVEKEKGQWTLSDAAKMLIDNHGENPEVLSAITANLNTFSWAGSLKPFYQRQIELLEPLLSHQTEPVRQWAENLISSARDQIESETRREEEHSIGRYT